MGRFDGSNQKPSLLGVRERKKNGSKAWPLILQNKKGPGDLDMVETLCKSPEEYAGFYRNVKKEFALGEISPSYLFFKGGLKTH